MNMSDLIKWFRAHKEEWDSELGLATSPQEDMVDIARRYLNDMFTIEPEGNTLIIGLPSASKETMIIDLELKDDLDDIRQDIHDQVIEYLGEVFLR